MMNKILMISSLVLSMLLSACTVIESPCIIGEKVAFSENEIGSETVWKLEPSKLDGNTRIEETIYHVKIANSDKVVATRVEWDSSKGTHILKTSDIIVTKLDDHLFLNIKDYDGGGDDEDWGILHIALSSSKKSFVVYRVDDEEMEKHISSGKVDAPGDGPRLGLKGTKEEIDKFVLENIRTIFDPDKVFVVTLISGEL